MLGDVGYIEQQPCPTASCARTALADVWIVCQNSVVALRRPSPE